MMLASLGSHVTSVDPQPDMLRYLESSASLNCWSDRINVHHALLTTDRDKHDLPGFEFKSSEMGGRPLCLNHSLISHFEDSRPSYFSFQHLLEEAGPDIQVIKYDAHIPEGPSAILDICLEFIAKGFSINSIIMEGAGLSQLFRFQELGYSIYKLQDPKVQTRFFDERGWDLLAQYQGVIDNEYMEEIFHQRAIPMMYRVKKLERDKFMQVPIPEDAEVLITKTQFVYPRNLHRYNNRALDMSEKKYFPPYLRNYSPAGWEHSGDRNHEWWLKRLSDFSGPGYDEYKKAPRPVLPKNLEELYLNF